MLIGLRQVHFLQDDAPPPTLGQLGEAQSKGGLRVFSFLAFLFVHMFSPPLMTQINAELE